MGSKNEPVGEAILQQIFDPEKRGEVNPTVLSCGGIYIPHRGSQERIPFQVITTSSQAEPVKVVTGARPRNILYEVLLKESMN